MELETLKKMVAEAVKATTTTILEEATEQRRKEIIPEDDHEDDDSDDDKDDEDDEDEKDDDKDGEDKDDEDESLNEAMKVVGRGMKNRKSFTGEHTIKSPRELNALVKKYGYDYFSVIDARGNETEYTVNDGKADIL